MFIITTILTLVDKKFAMTTTEKLTNTTYLITGGARSGKSSYAEKIAIESHQDVVYIATANTHDEEMQERVERHRNQRPKHWTTIEEPIVLARVLKKYSLSDNVILVDCLTMWITNLLMKQDDRLFESEIQKLHKTLETFSGMVIFVTNEVGMGIIPLGELSRRFVDESGRLHQQLASKIDNVLLMVAGLALEVKGKKPF